MVANTPRSRRKRAASRPLVVIETALVSLAVHAGVLAMAGGFDGLRAPGGLEAAAASAEAAAAAQRERGPLPSCEADEALATAAELLACSLPGGRAQGCLERALGDLRGASDRCTARTLPSAVTLLDPAVVDEIEPEPLAELIEPEVLEQIAQAQQQQQQQQQQQPPPPPPQPAQLVEITPSNDQAPDNARFLAEFDSRVDEQTVARGTTEEMVARPQPSPEQPDEIPQPKREAPLDDKAGANADAPEGPGQLAMRALGVPTPSREAREAVEAGALDGSDAPVSERGLETRRGAGERYEAARERLDPRRGEGGGGGGGRNLPNLRPSEELLERVVGGGSVDHLDNVAEGDSTALNARQWKFASFFNRSKRQVAQNWNPNRVIAATDPKGNVLGVKDRVTVLRITLDPSGALKDAIVLRSSGAEFLDAEAVRAFRAAQPFPNPPPGLVDASGEISFTFNFHLQMVARSTFKW
ncbi:energy transducer TonB family protein [Haliangium ochraceum]|uniref:TonB family protein n=1 Tax=Haliangium ochraceum (strain DSM 14365 / JCM 11303 / SMP-2) TaxID=502025 RepID=D0LTV5_HALO1|nr:energy transducer TonB [Haliangium ochraceum]ACY15799.1 TonB family protein [Haliangium ochraceum DSM 14365]